ncbi:MAG TPA: UDP-N-acetylmuramoyl-L-alanyl-D-glutamate--2,6-diaminopimelate ligase [Pseudothermotoga sp.]
MLVKELLKVVSDISLSLSLNGQSELEITGLTNKSTEARNGHLFICHKGSRFDSHDIVPEIIKKGISFLVVERPVQLDFPHVLVSDSRLAEALLAAHFYGYPFNDLITIGVTGTNGKTTSVHLFHHVLNSLGSRGSMLGTVYYDIIGENRFHHDNTTPGAIEILKAMRNTVDRNGTHFAMEVSSHSLAMKRVEGIRFDIAALTNITRDHLDFHQTFEDYTKTKLHIFDLLKDSGIALVSDEYEHLLNKKVKKIVYGISPKSDYKISDIDVQRYGTRFSLHCKYGTFECQINIPGVHNAYNATLVIAGLVELGYDMQSVIEAVKTFEGVDGRFQFIREGALLGIDIVVDFAHSPDALEKTLLTAKKLASGRIITVFGAGGQADKGKRPMMAEVVCRYSDVSIITTDDPRGEDAEEILSEVEKGVPAGMPYLVIPDRREAIETALTLANRGDMVVVAGRGHEEYQIFSDEKKIPFKDAEEIRKIIMREYEKDKRHV